MVIAYVSINVILSFEIFVAGLTMIFLIRAIMDIQQVSPHGMTAEQTLSTDHADEAILANLHLAVHRVIKSKA